MQGSTQDAGPSSLSPRANTETIKLILDKINRLPLLTGLQARGDFVWDDYLIPYGKSDLPSEEQSYRTEFFEEQKAHLDDPPQLIESLFQLYDEGSRPPHLRVNDIGKTLDIVGILGSGAFGEVLKLEVKWPPTVRRNLDARSKVFAMKRFPKKSASKSVESILDSFINERNNLEKAERCKHRHIVSFHASFTDESYFGFIMSPVAESNLKNLLENSRESNIILIDERKSLYEAFGCLLEAVRHLHEDLNMRHCDLKPSNILVCRLQGDHFRVRLCDLGISYAWDSSENESTDRNHRGTARYKAPEVRGETTSHNRMADIFSLGCIFLEMYAVLRGTTLDQMARTITDNNKETFDNHWTYADSLQGVRKWLEEFLQDDDDGREEVLVGLIKSMLCEDREERKKAENLFEKVRNYHQYIGECCRRYSPDESPSPPTDPEEPPGSDNSTPFVTCKILSRKKGLKSREYSNYKCIEDFQQGGEVEIQEEREEEREEERRRHRSAWAATRWIKVRPFQTSYTEVERWLPAYYVQSKQAGLEVTSEWSDCNQIHETQHNPQRSHRFEKVHCSSPDRNNVCLQIVFKNESDASDFNKLLLKEPLRESPLREFEINIPYHKNFTVCEHKWECSNKESARKGGKGSLVVSSQHFLQRAQSSRLEPLFVPHNFDFTLPLENDQRYNKLVSEYLWVPEYRSNVTDRYEEPKDNIDDKGIFQSVELVRLRKPYLFNFEAGSDTSGPSSAPVELLPNLQRFLKALTGWNPLTVFFATEVQQKKRMRHSRKGSADVLCFRKDDEKRIAIRRRSVDDQSTIEWMTATLESSNDLNNSKLKITMKSRQKGKKLVLATMTATDGDAKKPTGESEDWIFTINGGARKIDNTLSGPNQVASLESQR